MTVEVPRPVLKGRKALVVGVANEHSIAWGCAKAFRELGTVCKCFTPTMMSSATRSFAIGVGL